MKDFPVHKRYCWAPAIAFLVVPIAAGQNVKPRAPAAAANRPAIYRQAFNLLETHRPHEALEVIHAGLARNPADWQLYDLQGRAESAIGNPGGAEASFRKVIKLAPQRAVGYADLGVLMLQSGKNLEASQLFQSALDCEPEDFTARLGLGTALLALNQNEKAADKLKLAWSIDPRNFRAGYEYALALQELNRSKEAREVLSKLAAPAQADVAIKYYALSGMVAEDLEDWPAAAQDYSNAYRLAPGEVQIYSSWVRAAFNSKKAEAIQALPSPPAGLSADQHFSLGILFASVGSYSKAIPEFKAALQADPANYAAEYNLALSYQQSGKPQEAINVVRTAVRQKPTAELYNMLASLEESTGDYIQAARDFRQAVDLDPNNEEYYFDLGVEYLAHYAFQPALDVFRVGSQKFPGSLREKVGLGFAHYGLHQYSETEQAFLDAMEIDPSAKGSLAAWNTLTSFLTPDGFGTIAVRLRRLAAGHPSSAEALYYCGVSLFRSGEGMAKPGYLDAAADFLERAVRMRPGFAAAHLELGKLYASRNDNEKAVRQFLEAIRLDPQSADGHYQLGQAYRKLGQLKMAEQELAEYASLSQARRSQMSQAESEIKKFIVAVTPKQ